MKTLLIAVLSICSSFSAFAQSNDTGCASTASEGAKAIAIVNGATEADLKAPSISLSNPDRGTSYTVTFGKRVYTVETLPVGEGFCKVVSVTGVGDEL